MNDLLHSSHKKQTHPRWLSCEKLVFHEQTDTDREDYFQIIVLGPVRVGPEFHCLTLALTSLILIPS